MPTGRRDFRLAIEQRDAPTILRWGFLVYAIGAFADVVTGSNRPTDNAVDGLVLVIIAACILVVRSPRVAAPFIPWIISGVTSTVILGLSLQFHVTHNHPSVSFANCVLVMAMAGPLTLSVMPTLMTAGAFALANAIYSPYWLPADRIPWYIVSGSTVAVSLVLMHVRNLGIDELGHANELVRESSLRDHLTDALNRRGVEERVAALVPIAARQGRPVSVMFVDVDGLKRVNDEHGHVAGDDVIVAVARAVHACVRASDIVGRWGGDEFIVVGEGSPWDAEALQARIIDGLRRSDVAGERWTPSVSVGVATGPADMTRFDALLGSADADMYARRAVQRGR